MRVLVFESNLFWSSRLLKTLKELGFDSKLAGQQEFGPFEAEVALVNLGEPQFLALVPTLKESGVFVIGHAGHKEKELRELGRQSGCDRIASNSEITFKLKELLAEAEAPGT